MFRQIIFQRQARYVLLVCLLFGMLGGCAKNITVRSTAIGKRMEELDRTALYANKPSESTLRFLRLHDLLKKWKSEPYKTICVLDENIAPDTPRKAQYALMELSYLQARRAPKKSGKKVRLYMTCVVNAYNFLFNPKLKPILSPYDSRFRQACTYYNRSLAEILKLNLERDDPLKDRRHFDLVNGSLEIVGTKNEFSWDREELAAYSIAYNYKVAGLDNVYTQPGLGVPLILERNPPAYIVRKEERFISKYAQILAATALLRLKSFKPKKGEDGPVYEAVFEVWDPVNTDSVTIVAQQVPLEADVTTPLAYMVNKLPPPPDFSGLFNVRDWDYEQGLYMLEPYQKKKIPVVFVHGLFSSPHTWMNMFNDLLGDKELRERYQFWFYLYPTGNPILYSSHMLRKTLWEVRDLFDPKGTDASFNNMVLVGHSMGGILSQLMVQSRGDSLSQMVEENKKEQGANASAEDKELVKEMTDFEALPFVNRVVFLATPHRGAEMATSTLAQWAAAFITLPTNLVTGVFVLASDVLQAKDVKANMENRRKRRTGVPTSIDSLSPENPLLSTMVDEPIAPHVVYHSIMGNDDSSRTPDGPGSTDGIVAYESSYMDGAVSELVVPSGHSVHDTPQAVQEVKRILREQLKKVDHVE